MQRLVLASTFLCFTSTLAKKMIIDTDGGADDVMAIITALRLESDMEVVAVTTGCGNTNATQAAINVLKTLRVVGRQEIPVFRGCESYYTTSTDLSSDWFGSDGLGDFDFPNPPTEADISPEHGVLALLRLVKQNPKEISLVCLGPLTNVALAIKMDPKFLGNLDRIIVMGGAVKGVGNISPGAEFNFQRDPDAAKLVFEHCSESLPVVMVPWETCLDAKTTKYWRVSEFGSIQSPLMDFMNKAERIPLNRVSKVWIAPDSLAMLILLRPELTEKTESASVYVCAEGGMAKGVCLVERKPKTANTSIVKKINVDLFKRSLIQAFQNSSYYDPYIDGVNTLR